MEISWFGHSCFLIKSQDNITILTDPFNYLTANDQHIINPDIITISNNHLDHNSLIFKGKDTYVLDEACDFKLKNVHITGLHSYHDNKNGSMRGINIIFLIKIDSFVLCHLGVLGCELKNEFIKKLGDVDILFIPVGGNFTINGKTASSIAKKINSGLVIPMHYKTHNTCFPLEGAESFITHMKNAKPIHKNTITIKDKIEGKNNVMILSLNNVEKYAKGEISEEEYEKKKKVIQE